MGQCTWTSNSTHSSTHRLYPLLFWYFCFVGDSNCALEIGWALPYSTQPRHSPWLYVVMHTLCKGYYTTTTASRPSQSRLNFKACKLCCMLDWCSILQVGH